MWMMDQRRLRIASSSSRKATVKGFVPSFRRPSRRKGMFETPEEKIYQNYLAVKEMVETYLPEMKLHFGAEIYYTRDILEKLEAGTIPTLAETSLP